MSTQEDYTTDEWNRIISAPVIAGSVIVMVDPAFFGSIKESAAIAKAINEFAESSPVDLIKSIGAAVRGGQKPKMPDVPKGQTPDQVADALISECKEAVGIVADKSMQEANFFSQYLMDIAHATAESSKEGGFLGIGAVRVSEKEEAALERLAEALQVSPDESEDEEE